MRWKYESRRRSSLALVSRCRLPWLAAASDQNRARRQPRHRQHTTRATAAAVATARLVPPGELAEAVPRRRRARLHRLVVQVALHVRREAVGRLVAAVAVLLQRLHHDPVQLAAHQLRQLRRLRASVRGQGRQALRRAQLGARLRSAPPRGSPAASPACRPSPAPSGERRACRSAARTAARPASRCRCGCRCRGC